MKEIILTITILNFYLFSFSQETGTFTDDRDGRTYKTVKIGDQIWMAANFAYRPNKGVGKIYRYFGEDNEVAKELENYKIYGVLYYYDDISRITPKGWHLPSDEEWKTLFNYLGGEKKAGGKLKAKTGWREPNKKATNKSGFSAIPAGRWDNYNYEFQGIGSWAYFWSSTQYGFSNGYTAGTIVLNHNTGIVYISSDKCSNCHSVRFIKDK